jgi:hypothetical protein
MFHYVSRPSFTFFTFLVRLIFHLEGVSGKNRRSVVKYVAEVSLTASRDELSNCQEYPWRVAKKA